MNAVRAALDLATIRDLVGRSAPCRPSRAAIDRATAGRGPPRCRRWGRAFARPIRWLACTWHWYRPSRRSGVWLPPHHLMSQLIPGGVAFDRPVRGASRCRTAAGLAAAPSAVRGCRDRPHRREGDCRARRRCPWLDVDGRGPGRRDRTQRPRGGWSQPRYQRRAEDSWQHNAMAVADAVTQATRDLHAGLLLVAGDVRAVQLLRDHLPPETRRQVTLRSVPGAGRTARRPPAGPRSSRRSTRTSPIRPQRLWNASANGHRAPP
jgi:hypothetical protein